MPLATLVLVDEGGGVNKKLVTLVDGMLGNTNREDTIDQVFLPISMGCRLCYKRYMLSLGLHTKCAPDGAIVVDGILTFLNRIEVI